MVNRHTAIESLLLFVVFLVVLLGSAVFAGIHKCWLPMTFFFVGAGFFAGACFNIVIAQTIDTRFNHLEDIVLQKIHPKKPVMTEESNRKTFRRSNKAKALEITFGTIGVVSIPIYASLGILSGLHQAWLMFSVYLFSYTITTAICVGVLLSLKIVTRSRHIEELISACSDLS